MFCIECGEKLDRVELMGVTKSGPGLVVDLLMWCKNAHEMHVHVNQSNTPNVDVRSRNKALVKELEIYVEIAGHRERVKLFGEE